MVKGFHRMVTASPYEGLMASPLKSGKQSVDMSAPVVRVSRIRRDPPPKVKEVTLEDIKERDRRNAIIGVLVFAVAIFVILLGFSAAAGWTPRSYTLHFRI